MANVKTVATTDGFGAYSIAEVAHNALSALALSSKSHSYCHSSHEHHWKHALSISCRSVDDGWMRNCYLTFVSVDVGLICWGKRA